MRDVKFENLIRAVEGDREYQPMLSGYTLTYEQFEILDKAVQLNTMRKIERVMRNKDDFMRSAHARRRMQENLDEAGKPLPTLTGSDALSVSRFNRFQT